MNDLKTQIMKSGQPYFDEPVHLHPKPPEMMALHVKVALYPERPLKMPKSLLVGHERTRLNWVKPK